MTAPRPSHAQTLQTKMRPRTLLLLPLLLLLAATHATAYAQHIAPVKRFHEKDSPFRDYQDNFISGFMQTCGADSLNGFLQMPFVGDPLLLYVGEKDSTQFMAYASGFENLKSGPAQEGVQVDLIRYGIKAEISAKPGHCVQRYSFPDTTASKGFLVDLDHALHGAGNGDMDVKFIDRTTIRAYRRGKTKGDGEPELYYVAHFSHPFTTWNVRREKVRLKNGAMEKRCKVAFTFEIENGETLTVQSAVSARSTDDAYAQIKGLPAERNFSDTRSKPREDDKPAMAQHVRRTAGSTRRHATTAKAGSSARSGTGTDGDFTASLIEITTLDARLRAAFYNAMNSLLQTPECRTVDNGADFLSRIGKFYEDGHATARPAEAEQTDSLLRHYAGSLFTGEAGKVTEAQAAWYVFHALGFCPADTPGAYRLTRPVFNVTTIRLPQGRRFILHTKGISPRRGTIGSATLSHEPLPENLTFTQEQMLRGGIMEIKMKK